MLSNLSELELVKAVKDTNDETALLSLIHSNSGIYIEKVNKYTYVPYFERQELLDHKMLNIYNYAKEYDENRGMKFSVYVGQRIEWQCMSLVNKYKEPDSLEKAENIEDSVKIDINKLDMPIDLSEIRKYINKVKDRRFKSIFNYRNSENKKTWHEIAKIMKISHEGARKIYNKNLDNIKKEFNKHE